MRTKTLLLTAAVAIAGIATPKAQDVVSVNTVGYVNHDIPAGFSLVANPLAAADNSVPALFADAPGGTSVYKLSGGTFDILLKNFLTGEWEFSAGGEGLDPSDITLSPGEGVFVQAPEAFEQTFVGEVMEGELSNPIPEGFSIRSSQVPQAGDVQTLDLGDDLAGGDQIYKFNVERDAYDIFLKNFLTGEWEVAAGDESAPLPPVLGIAEAVFIQASAATSWNRNFSVSGSE